MTAPAAEKTAVLLAGGLGSRLLPYTISIPKPLLPIADRPIIEYCIRQLQQAGFREVVISLGYLGELIEAYLGDGSKYGISIRYFKESEPLGTAGALRLIPSLPDRFLVMNGDLLTTLDYGALFRYAEDNESIATIATTRRNVPVDYGVLHVGRAGRLERFEEKPELAYEVSTGVYILAQEALTFIERGRFDMPDLFQRLITEGLAVHCFATDCYWRDVGRFDDFEEADRDVRAEPGRFMPVIGDSEGG